MILLWGVEEAPLRLLRDGLEEIGATFLFLNHADLSRVHLEVEYSPRAAGVLEVNGTAYRLEAFRSVFVRPHDVSDLPDFVDREAASAGWRHAGALQSLLWSYADVADALVVNRPSAMLSNGSKPYQSRLIEKQGFEVPETLLTTDPEAVRRFRAAHADVIYKSISGTRSIVSRLNDGHDGRLEDVRWCPTQFQRYVDGIDYRVHVVGNWLVAARILSDAVDYRYGTTEMERCELPASVAGRCLALSQALRLPLAGIDLRQAADGRWFCFEVNPAPGFSAYGVEIGREIGHRIARLLAEHDERGCLGARREGTYRSWPK
jgi:hypothetical protein